MNLFDLFRKNKVVTTPAGWETTTRNFLGKLKSLAGSRTVVWGVYLALRVALKGKDITPDAVSVYAAQVGPLVDAVLPLLDVIASWKVLNGRTSATTVFKPDGTPVDVSHVVNGTQDEISDILTEIARDPRTPTPFQLTETLPDAFASQPEVLKPGDLLKRVTAQKPLSRPANVEDETEALRVLVENHPEAKLAPTPQLERTPLSADDRDKIALANPDNVEEMLARADGYFNQGLSPRVIVSLLTARPAAPAKKTARKK